ncbi:hypothetical protein CI105_03490 [Candidatus Izimaplasma bacterium ZiA1]|uniref:ArsR/SmtB family transcription factor n=1 Tax=Candidatus Izimoplasma sp. ZiA1 TaxID=2024899 RepID=UPI000BAA6432|nr:hypothetical protein CI105_03490 [Candidatus Izimaplasma bacterium ZiA1]
MKDLTALFKVLSDETRIRIINLLSKKSLCVCELVEILELSQPKISKHIAKLREIDIVDTKRDEQFIYYSIKTNNHLYLQLLTTIFTSITDNEVLNDDLKKLDAKNTFKCSGGLL